MKMVVTVLLFYSIYVNCPHALVQPQLEHTHTHNRFTALWNLSGTTRV